MEIKNVKTITENLNKFGFYSKDNEYITVTEDEFGEGWNIDLHENLIHLHYSELEAINFLTKVLLYENYDSENRK